MHQHYDKVDIKEARD